MIRFSIGAPQVPAEQAVFIASPTVQNAAATRIGGNSDWPKMANRVASDLDRRPMTRKMYGVSTVANGGARVFGAFGDFDSFASDHWNGAEARIYRVVDGAFTLAQTTTVADHYENLFVRRLNTEATSAVFKFDDFNEPGRTYHFVVQAYDAAGGVGAYAYVAWAAPSAWGAESQLANTATESKTITESVIALAAPETFTATSEASDRRGVTLSWAAVTGAEGYRVQMSNENPVLSLGQPTAISSYVDLAGGVTAQTGDLLLLSRIDDYSTVTISPRLFNAASGPPKSLSFLNWGDWRSADTGKTWLFKPHAGGDYTGRTRDYLEITMGAGVSDRALVYLATGSGGSVNSRTFYKVLEAGKTYRAEVWARSDGTRTLNPTMSGEPFTVPGVTVTAVNDVAQTGSFPVVWTVTTQWTLLSFEFRTNGAYTGGALGAFEMPLAGPARYDFSDFRVYETGTPFNRLTPREFSRLEAANLGLMREHATVKTNRPGRAYDLHDLIVRVLHDSLTQSAALAADYWIQPEFYLDDWGALAEYLFAPNGTSEWTALRAALGRSTPWSDAFGTLYFEISNETWNSVSDFYQFPELTVGGTDYESSQVYGLFNEYVIQRLKASPHFPANKVKFMLGGWTINDFGEKAAAVSPSADFVTYAPYLGGWEAGAVAQAEVPIGYHEFLFYTPVTGAPRTTLNKANVATAIAAGANPSLKIGSYEDNFGFGLPEPGSNQNPLDRTAKSKSGGAALLDKFMRQIYDGYEIQAYFTVERGQLWKSSQFAEIGDASYADFQWFSLFNAKCAGVMHQTTRLKAPTRTVTFDATDYPNTDEIAVYVTSSGSRRSVILINRNLPWSSLPSGDALYDANDDGVRSVRVMLPWVGATSLTKHVMDGAYNAQNFDPIAATYRELNIREIALGAHSGDLVVTLPPASAEVYVFEGVTS